jgi:fucose permease
MLSKRRIAVTLALAALGFVGLGVPEGLLGVAWPSIRTSFNLPLDALGLLLATFASGYCVSSAISGRVIGRFGIGSVLAISCACIGAALLGYAFSPAWLSMVALGGVAGIGAGTIDASLNTYAAIAYGSRVLNWLHAAFGMGAAIGPLLMTAILGGGLPWTLGYGLVGAAMLGLASAYWLTRQRFAPAPGAHAGHPARRDGVGQNSSGHHAVGSAHASAPYAEPPRRSVATDTASARELLRAPAAWLSLALFFVYVGVEVTAGQWSFSLLTLSRGTPPAVAGVLISAYWTSLTLGRVLFGVIVTRVAPETLLRACMLAAIVAAAVLWLNVPLVSWAALALLGLLFAPIFPVLIAETPSRLGSRQTANAVGLQVAAAVAGGAALPSAVGVVAARTTLEVIGPALVLALLVQLLLHEALIRIQIQIRPASGRPRSARSRNSAGVTAPPGA